MADQDTIQLKVTEDTRAVEQARSKVRDLKAELDDLNDAFNRGSVGGEQFRAAQARIAAELSQSERTIARAATATESLSVSAKGLEHSSKSGAMGLMMMAQMADDAQYGFRAIVNNIPMAGYAIGEAMGLSSAAAAKLGGALGMTAVAVNQNINRWEEWKEILSDIASNGYLQQIADGLKSFASNMDESFLGGWGGAIGQELRDKAEAGRQKAETDKQAASGKGWVEGLTDEDSRLRAKAIGDAIRSMPGGGRALRQKMVADAAAAGGDRASAERDVDTIFGDIMRGNEDAINRFLPQLDPEAREKYNQAPKTGFDVQWGKQEEEKRKSRERLDEYFEKQDEEKRKQVHEFGPTMEDFRKGHKDQVGRYASALQEGFNEQAIFGNGTRTWVENQLSKQGVKEEDLDSIAGDVMDKLRDAYDKKVSQEAGRLNTDKAGAEAQMRHDFVEKRREWQMQQVEANMGMAVAQKALFNDLYKAPERIAMTDAAKHVESGGAKDQLQIMREQLAVMKAIEQATKVANHPPKLGR